MKETLAFDREQGKLWREDRKTTKQTGQRQFDNRQDRRPIAYRTYRERTEGIQKRRRQGISCNGFEIDVTSGKSSGEENRGESMVESRGDSRGRVLES
jgi:hypothetical protein